MKRIKKLEQLKVNKTYKVCNYDVTFENMYITPIEIFLSERKLVYENCARNRITRKFNDKCDEISFFNFMNLY